MEIDRTTYPATTKNYYKVDHAKTQIVIGFSLREGHNYILRMQNKEYGRSKKWNTYTVSREGIIYEHFDPKKHSDFLGIKEVDINIISIIIENTGYLVKNNDGLYVNLLNEICDVDRVGLKKWESFSYWEKIDEKQMMGVVNLCNHLSNVFNIPNECIEFENYNKTVSKFKGIVFRSNYLESGVDINPFFNIGTFNKLLKSTE